MEPEIAKLLRELERYRLLLKDVVDDRVCEVIIELIIEAEARLAALQRTVDED